MLDEIFYGFLQGFGQGLVLIAKLVVLGIVLATVTAIGVVLLGFVLMGLEAVGVL